jgi:imidazolonepropionase-like amidohydrolase
VTVIRIRGYALPEGDPVDLYADGDRWTTDPVPGAELVAEGWLLPGLVDAHTAASWAARSYLGIPGLASGAPADAVVFDTDPRTDLTQLDTPRAVIARGRPVHRRA